MNIPVISSLICNMQVLLCHTHYKQSAHFETLLSFEMCFEMLMQMSVELLSLNDFIVNLLSVRRRPTDRYSGKSLILNQQTAAF